MIDQRWEDGLREALSDAAEAPEVTPPPIDAIVRRGRVSVRWRTTARGSGAVVATAAVIAAGTLWNHAIGTEPKPNAANGAGAVVTMGPANAAVVVTIWDDYRCAPCRSSDMSLAPLVEDLVNSGQIRVEYRTVNIVDDRLGGNGSLVAANAAQCAAESGKYFPYRDVLFEDQQYHQDGEADVYSDASTMFYVADAVPGLDTAEFEACVRNQPYATAIRANSAAFTAFQHGKATLPYIKVDGKVVADPTSNPDVMMNALNDALAHTAGS